MGPLYQCFFSKISLLLLHQCQKNPRVGFLAVQVINLINSHKSAKIFIIVLSYSFGNDSDEATTFLVLSSFFGQDLLAPASRGWSYKLQSNTSDPSAHR